MSIHTWLCRGGGGDLAGIHAWGLSRTVIGGAQKRRAEFRQEQKKKQQKHVRAHERKLKEEQKARDKER